MSYARFSEGDVYVYGAGGTGTGKSHKYICCDCALPTGTRQGESLAFDSAEAILKHLEAHHAIGHRVPEHAFDRIRREPR